MDISNPILFEVLAARPRRKPPLSALGGLPTSLLRAGLWQRDRLSQRGLSWKSLRVPGRSLLERARSFRPLPGRQLPKRHTGVSAAGTKRRPFPWVGTGAPAHYIPVSSIPVAKSARAAGPLGTARDSQANVHSSEGPSQASSHEGLGFAVTVLAIVLAAVI